MSHIVVMIGGRERERIAEVIAHAEANVRPYYNAGTVLPPESRVQLGIASLNSVDCRFTIDHALKGEDNTPCVVRHLSVRVSSRFVNETNRVLPKPMMVEIATAFGFTEAAIYMAVAHDIDGRASIHVVEEVGP